MADKDGSRLGLGRHGRDDELGLRAHVRSAVDALHEGAEGGLADRRRREEQARGLRQRVRGSPRASPRRREERLLLGAGPLRGGRARAGRVDELRRGRLRPRPATTTAPACSRRPGRAGSSTPSPPTRRSLVRTFDEKQITFFAGDDVGTNASSAVYLRRPGDGVGRVRLRGQGHRAHQPLRRLPLGGRGARGQPGRVRVPLRRVGRARRHVERLVRLGGRREVARRSRRPTGRYLQWKVRMSAQGSPVPHHPPDRGGLPQPQCGADDREPQRPGRRPRSCCARARAAATCSSRRRPTRRGSSPASRTPSPRARRASCSARASARCSGRRRTRTAIRSPTSSSSARSASSKWITLRKDVRDTFYAFDTTSLPDGDYVFRVTASDAEANPGDAKTTSRESAPVRIDNTPPVIRQISSAPGVFQFEATDSASPLTEAEYSVDAKKWTRVEPKDGLVRLAAGDLRDPAAAGGRRRLPPGPRHGRVAQRRDGVVFGALSRAVSSSDNRRAMRLGPAAAAGSRVPVGRVPRARDAAGREVRRRPPRRRPPPRTPSGTRTSRRARPSRAACCAGASSASPPTLNAVLQSSTPEAQVLQYVQRKLLDFDAGMRLIPGLAERWESSPDGLEYTLTLRPDAVWEDGRPVTARGRRLHDPADRGSRRCRPPSTSRSSRSWSRSRRSTRGTLRVRFRSTVRVPRDGVRAPAAAGAAGSRARTSCARRRTARRSRTVPTAWRRGRLRNRSRSSAIRDSRDLPDTSTASCSASSRTTRPPTGCSSAGELDEDQLDPARRTARSGTRRFTTAAGSSSSTTWTTTTSRSTTARRSSPTRASAAR